MNMPPHRKLRPGQGHPITVRCSCRGLLAPPFFFGSHYLLLALLLRPDRVIGIANYCRLSRLLLCEYVRCPGCPILRTPRVLHLPESDGSPHFRANSESRLFGSVTAHLNWAQQLRGSQGSSGSSVGFGVRVAQAPIRATPAYSWAPRTRRPHRRLRRTRRLRLLWHRRLPGFLWCPRGLQRLCRPQCLRRLWR